MENKNDMEKNKLHEFNLRRLRAQMHMQKKIDYEQVANFFNKSPQLYQVGLHVELLKNHEALSQQSQKSKIST